MKSKASLLLILFACVTALLAQTNNAFNGKWELNVAKSKFSPGPALKSETVTITDTKTAVEGTDPDGKPFQWSFAASNGAPVPIEGLEDSTVEGKVSGNTVDHTWKIAGGNEHGHGVLVKGGKVMKYTMTGTDGQGRAVHNVYIFDKQ